ncbi:hypothetical protein [Marinimicrobium sp. ABcell2]|uniref:hypothetical protein n=1 Tax=Marinimicrobium sp. ABcell2 TaxID=3069751 RepID=UPI0027B42BEC|nr:hypothetical protein [Marinimicrobium sp. ABcell2]MDQ2075227.1 hypothetical protein [Marinimicrobium sp. ABcell2]
MTSRQARVFEWLLVASIIGVVMTVGAGFYGRMAEDVRRLSFELAAEHFKTGVSAVRAYTYIHRGSEELERGIELYSDLPGLPGHITPDSEPVRVFLNRYGWPAATERQMVNRPSAEACLQLWYAFLHQPPSAAVQEASNEAEYRVSLTRDGQCRYQRRGERWQGAYFDYSPVTGAVSVVLPEE